MPKITVSVTIKKPKDEVYNVIKDMEDFPHFMRDIKTLKITKHLEVNKVITAWDIDIEGAPISWKEEDCFDDLGQEIRFNMLEGNYKGYEGRWLIGDHQRGTKLTLEADFDWGIPVLEKFIGRKLEQKARRGLLGMVQAVKTRLERSYV